ncbi:endothelin-converting enzyme-like 1 [Amblyomma americanum]
MQHAFLLSAALNRSLDPCEDFGAYVCSAWLSSSAHSRSLQEDLWYRWTKQTAHQLVRQRLFPEARPMVKAATMLQRCLDMDGDSSRENTRIFHHFLRQRNLSAAPGEQTVAGAHALDVLLDLAINWRMSLWFSVAMLSGHSADSVGLLIDYGRYDPYWVNSAPPHVSNGTEREDVAMDQFILQTLRDLSDTKLQFKPRIIRIVNITKLTPDWSSQLWLEFLNKHLAPAFKLTVKSQVLLTDSNLLEVIGGAVARYGNQAVLQHIVRVLNKTFSNLASTSTPYFYDPEESYSAQPENATLVCQLQVEDVFKPVLAISHVMAKKLVARRANADDILNTVLHAAGILLENTKWTGEKTTTRALNRIASASVKLWPEGQLMDGTILSDLYRSFPNGREAYVREMIESRATIRSYLGTEYYAHLTATPHGGRQPYLSYNVFNNSFTISVSALSTPLYYPEGTLTMNYGGLGSRFAAWLLRAIDNDDLSLGPEGWTLDKTESMYMKAPCVDVSFSGFYPNLPSLELAHKAYLDALRRTGKSEDDKLASLDEFSAEQVFFLSFCQPMCRISDNLKTSAECNVAVRNFKPFAKAFRCKRGSNMNPDQKCAFFTSS